MSKTDKTLKKIGLWRLVKTTEIGFFGGTTIWYNIFLKGYCISSEIGYDSDEEVKIMVLEGIVKTDVCQELEREFITTGIIRQYRFRDERYE